MGAAWQTRLQLSLLVATVVTFGAYALTGKPAAGQPVAVQPTASVGPGDTSGPIPRIAIVYDVDGRGTTGFSALAWEGVTRGAAYFEGEVKEVTDRPDDTDAEREAVLAELADDLYQPIFVIAPAYARAVAAVAPRYPRTWFGMLDDGTVDARNVVGVLFNVEQGAFLVGAAAALTSTTGTVGFIGGADVRQLPRLEAGFAAGARAADPDVTVQVTYLPPASDLTGPDDPAGAGPAALAMYDAGADVIFAAAGESSAAVFQAASERGRWAIGADGDAYLVADPSVRDAILTSMIKRADTVTYKVLMEVANSVQKDGNNVFGLDQGGLGFATSGGFVDGIKAQLDAFAARIAAGEILVPIKP